MLWRGRRESSNVEDRRGMKTVGAVGGGTLIIALIYALLGGDPTVILNNAGSPGGQNTEELSAEHSDDASQFVKVILGDTEDVWRKLFANEGQRYPEPRLVLFSQRVQSACGVAGSSVGPFYCPADQKVYLDLSFFQELSDRLGAKGDFAQAYVIAHEIGHHVQRSLGISSRWEGDRSSQASVQIELQADCLAGVWAKETNKINRSIEEGDIEEAMAAASAVGDDKLQEAAQGYVVPDSFTHGSSAQRMAAFENGFTGGDIAACTGGSRPLNATR